MVRSGLVGSRLSHTSRVSRCISSFQTTGQTWKDEMVPISVPRCKSSSSFAFPRRYPRCYPVFHLLVAFWRSFGDGGLQGRWTQILIQVMILEPLVKGSRHCIHTQSKSAWASDLSSYTTNSLRLFRITIHDGGKEHSSRCSCRTRT
jgi:hypothetical protein